MDVDGLVSVGTDRFNGRSNGTYGRYLRFAASLCASATLPMEPPTARAWHWSYDNKPSWLDYHDSTEEISWLALIWHRNVTLTWQKLIGYE